MIFENFMFQIDGKNMKNEKNSKMFSVTFFYCGLKTPFPVPFSRAYVGDTIYISILEIHFRDFPLYFYWICLPGSGTENLVSLGIYCTPQASNASHVSPLHTPLAQVSAASSSHSL